MAGVVTYDGPIPKAVIPDDTGSHRNLLHVDLKTRGVQYTVAYLVPATPGAPALTAELLVLSGTPAVVDQQDQLFRPHLIAVRAGEPVRFSNSDTVNHNVRATSAMPANVFSVITGMDGAYVHRFVADPHGRPVPLGCDIHPWMSGWIYVFDHPWFAVTDAQGRFRIADVPQGVYRLVVEQPDIQYQRARPIRVELGETLRVEVEVSASQVR